MHTPPITNDRSASARVSKKAFALAIFLVVGVVVLAWWFQPADPAASLRAIWSPYARLQRQPVPRLGERVERWRIIDKAGHSVRALWRPAVAGTSRPWTVVMLGGVETDERAVLLLPADARANVLSVSWAWNIAPRESLLNALQFRGAALHSAAALALAMDALVDVPESDPTRVVLLGVSLGVPPALAALQLSDKPRALVLVDGAADLKQVIQRRLARKLRPQWLAAPVAALIARLIRPLEPSLNLPRAAGLSALVINARNDKFLPIATIERLRAALPKADKRWRQDSHIEPEHGATIAALAAEVTAWLQSLK